MRGSPHYSYADRSTLYVYRAFVELEVQVVYPRFEGSGAKFEVYLGIATAARALRAGLEDIQTQLRHHSHRVSVEFLDAHWR